MLVGRPKRLGSRRTGKIQVFWFLSINYTRNRTNVPAQMIQQLVKDIVAQEHRFEEPEDAVLDEEDEASLTEVQFYVKSEGRASHDYRYHCLQLGDDSALACGRLEWPIAQLSDRRSQMRPCSASIALASDLHDLASRCFSSVGRAPGMPL